MTTTAEELAKTLLLNNDYSQYFVVSNIINYIFRYIGQLLSKLINVFFEPSSNFINQIYKYATGSGIAQNTGLLKAIPELNFLIPILIALAFLLYFISLALNGRESKIHMNHIFRNLMIAIIIFFGGTSLFSALNDITYQSIQFIDIGYSSYQYGQTVKHNTYDLAYLLNNVNTNGKISNNAIKTKNNLDVTYCANINPVETIDEPKDVITQGNRKNDVIEMLGYKVYSPTNTNVVGFTELENNLFFDEHYYRYDINWTVIIITEICQMLVIAITCIGIIRRVFDATISFFVLTVTSFADLTRGRITKNLIEYILKCYITLILTALIYKIYSYLMISIPSNFNTFGEIIIIITLTLITIDGPAFVEKNLTGQDAGIGDGFKAISQIRNSVAMTRDFINLFKHKGKNKDGNNDIQKIFSNLGNNSNKEDSLNKSIDKDTSNIKGNTNPKDMSNDNINNKTNQPNDGFNNDMNNDLSNNPEQMNDDFNSNNQMDDDFNNDLNNDLNENINNQSNENLNQDMQNDFIKPNTNINTNNNNINNVNKNMDSDIKSNRLNNINNNDNNIN